MLKWLAAIKGTITKRVPATVIMVAKGTQTGNSGVQVNVLGRQFSTCSLHSP